MLILLTFNRPRGDVGGRFDLHLVHAVLRGTHANGARKRVRSRWLLYRWERARKRLRESATKILDLSRLLSVCATAMETPRYPRCLFAHARDAIERDAASRIPPSRELKRNGALFRSLFFFSFHSRSPNSVQPKAGDTRILIRNITADKEARLSFLFVVIDESGYL